MHRNLVTEVEGGLESQTKARWPNLGQYEINDHTVYYCRHTTTTCAPTSESSEQDMEFFYEQPKTTLKHSKKQELNLLMGDFNAKVGKGAEDNSVDQFGLETRNDRVDRLIQFYQGGQCNNEHILPADHNLLLRRVGST